MGEKHTIRISGGAAEAVYHDDLAGLLKEGQATITRASHVEPHPTAPGWLADMRPSGGPVIGKNGTSVDINTDPDTYDVLDGFDLREEALAAEREWLAREKGL